MNFFQRYASYYWGWQYIIHFDAYIWVGHSGTNYVEGRWHVKRVHYFPNGIAYIKCKNSGKVILLAGNEDEKFMDITNVGDISSLPSSKEYRWDDELNKLTKKI